MFKLEIINSFHINWENLVNLKIVLALVKEKVEVIFTLKNALRVLNVKICNQIVRSGILIRFSIQISIKDMMSTCASATGILMIGKAP